VHNYNKKEVERPLTFTSIKCFAVVVTRTGTGVTPFVICRKVVIHPPLSICAGQLGSFGIMCWSYVRNNHIVLLSVSEYECSTA
jgi:hypothetical protein